ncbi:MAG: 16S rRNA (cytidine(1402)-2'-O)-methyltransferase [Deltaproteobacteria bacterium]|nr:16S rRNA (cytidine(1402)-2'-O)-methyltransferase [Deltaproteobacteria bacterium]
MSSTPPRLWVVATPLGNLGDLSFRAREVLSRVSTILAEDTRRARHLYDLLEIPAPRLISSHEHNEESRVTAVLDLLSREDVALISDAGTPLVSDPGFVIVRACREAGIEVVPIPGPCAPVAALMASGFPPQPFVFLGFLPRRPGAIRDLFLPYAGLSATMAFFERKDRVSRTLETLFPVLGPRRFCLARELTKVHEEFIFGVLGQELKGLDELRGEITVLVAPPEQKPERVPRELVENMVREETARGGRPRAVAKIVSGRCPGWSSGEVYALLLERR